MTFSDSAISLDGQNYKELKRQSLQKRCPFNDLHFKANDDKSDGFHDKHVPKGLHWKRPKDLCNTPKFISKEFTLTNIDQGKMGDSCFVGIVASLSLYPQFLQRVIPQDQNFDDDAGIFHFQFGQWVDVVVDDWLPTLNGELLFAKPTKNDEFWMPLLEKAYAKLKGSYKAIYSGVARNAFVDLTGGIGETIFLGKGSLDQDPDVCMAIQVALDKTSSIGAGIWVSKSRTHTYSIMGVHKLTVEGKEESILRLRNPWGEREWNEDWSDNSIWWLKVNPEDQKFLVQKDDREFWMKAGDFGRHFDVLHICHLSADAPDEEAEEEGGSRFCWNSSCFRGHWVESHVGAGAESSKIMWTNPQFHVSLLEPDVDGSTCTLLVSLMQKDQRRSGKKFPKIGIAVYKVTKEYLKLKDSAQREELFSDLKPERNTIYRDKEDITERFVLPPGDYLVMPSMESPQEEADFILRIFTDKQNQSCEWKWPPTSGSKEVAQASSTNVFVNDPNTIADSISRTLCITTSLPNSATRDLNSATGINQVP